MAAAPDVVVIGAGSFGAWSAWHLAAAGHRVTLVDAFGAGHSRASSGGESRIIRRGYGDRALYSRWAQASLPQWKALAADSGQALFLETGVLWLGRGEDDHVDASERILAGLGVATEPLTRADLAARLPQLDPGSAARGVLEPGAGVLLARRAVDRIARHLPLRFPMFVWHNDEVRAEHPDMVILASSDACPNQVWRYRDRAVWGIQGHPEVNPESARQWLGERRPRLERDGADVDALICDAGDVSAAETLFENFIAVVREHRREVTPSG